MWFEIIPSFAIITVALAVPGVVKYFGHQLIFGNANIRDKTNRWERYMYQRDERLTGDPYKANGLEAIPDE
ncbi:NADH dehydrogenase [ubiquinone] 1 alpha subcomplex subunit 1 [Cryptotermes secundus]|uniref:NADH dehydrogenase [ubiquinone] 1 alpha subcomplex subunit 1 n=1 Tax=Cryptotermes secundus TaxID=105785 RepID=UPI000CD7AB6F|nr:NADH dehydrogenase [ubiquinone] 1 alpha subcomplex subunit 1 [Cryptotermes secundus]